MKVSERRFPTTNDMRISAARDVMELLEKKLAEKGDDAFISQLEILGAITQEYHEVEQAIHSKNDTQTRRELLDLAAACIFSIASLDAMR
jgi:hypothetical protein